MPSAAFTKLRSRLAELFQLDAAAELDFGIYRILNCRRAEIAAFLDSLEGQVDAILGQAGTDAGAPIRAELEKVEAGLRAGGFGDDMIAAAPKVKELREKLAALGAAGQDTAALRNSIFSDLTTFFSRYYKDGDFLSLRRYKADTYAIPYEGEEVKLHWANADQFYIKSAENFRDYTFRLGPAPSNPDKPDTRPRVTFKLVEADTDKDNNKPAAGSERRFIYHGVVSSDASQLTLGFTYLPAGKDQKQAELNTAAARRILDECAKGPFLELAALRPTDKRKDRSLLEKHLADYTARNTFDYFIHKDLGGFLRRELDFFIKNEVVHLDDLDEAPEPLWTALRARLKALRAIAHKVIRFLAQIEDFQRKLWLKKKFVTTCDYVITLDRLPEELYPAIASCEAQREEWVRLFAIDEIKGDLGRVGYSVPLSVNFLRENKFLPVDTRLVSMTDDSVVDCESSLAVYGDNFQSLNFLTGRHKGDLACIYFDPPYNTGNDGFSYKDAYQTSSWASCLSDRITLARQLLRDRGVVFTSINEIERNILERLLMDVFGRRNRVEELIWVQDTVRNNSPTYSTNHEYIEVFAKDKALVETVSWMFREQKQGYAEIMEIVEEMNPDYPPLVDVEAKISELMKKHRQAIDEEARDRGEDPAEARKNDAWNGIYPYCQAEYRDDEGRFVPETEARARTARIWIWREVDPSMPSGKQSDTTRDPSSLNYRYYRPPHPETGRPCVHPKRGWAFPHKPQGDRPSFDGYVEDSRIVFRGENKPPQMKYFLHEVADIVSKSVIRQYADGEQHLDDLFGRKGLFPNPKPPGLIQRLASQTCDRRDTVLDFFAGSGTTGHAVINLNREDNGNRRYILVEMGEHFDTVLVPRLKKVIYAKDWKDGKPVSRDSGVSHCFKVLRLESYEDTLNNLRLVRTPEQQATLDRLDRGELDLGGPDAAEDYRLGYMLDLESTGSASLLNASAFTDPWNYSLDIATGTAGETKPVAVDLVETFNWLLGLTVQGMARSGGVLWVEGINPQGEKVLVLWRKTAGTDSVDAPALNEWCRKMKVSVLDGEYHLIYVNGDHHLDNLRREDQTWKVRLIDEEFPRLMFSE